MRQEFFYCSKCLNTTVLLYYTIYYSPFKVLAAESVLYKQLNIL